MPRDGVDEIFALLGQRFPAFKRFAPVVALVGLLGVIGFAVFALRGAVSTSSRSISTLPPADDASAGSDRAFERVWAATIGTIQDLALLRPAERPAEVLALVGNTVSRFDIEGRLITEFAVRPGTSRLTAAADARVPFFLAASMDSHWSWRAWLRITTAMHLTAIDPQGRTVWTYTLREDPSLSPFEPLFSDGGDGQDTGIIVDVGRTIVGLDTSGRQQWSMPDEFRSAIAVDTRGDGRPSVMVLRPSGERTEVATLDVRGQRTHVAWLSDRSLADAWYVARLHRGGEPMIAALSMSSTPDASGKMPETLSVYTIEGESIGRTTLPWPTRPIVTRPLASVDTDEDGSSAWVAAGDNGAFFLFSRDATTQEVHHTGRHIRRFLIAPRSQSSDLIVVGTEKGIEVWSRRAQVDSAVD